MITLLALNLVDSNDLVFGIRMEMYAQMHRVWLFFVCLCELT